MILEAAVIVLGLLWVATLWVLVTYIRRQRVSAAQQAGADELRDRRLKELTRRLDTYQNGSVQMGGLDGEVCDLPLFCTAQTL